jgi:hypothetical protein
MRYRDHFPAEPFAPGRESGGQEVRSELLAVKDESGPRMAGGRGGSNEDHLPAADVIGLIQQIAEP